MRSILYSLIITLSVCISLFSFQSASAQYCVNNLYVYGCIYGDYMDNIAIGSISQNATGCSQNGYADFTSLTSNFEQGSTYTLQLTVGHAGQSVSMWIDFNDDGTFSSSEKLLANMECNSLNVTYTQNFIIPWSAAIGSHRMRVRCAAFPNPLPLDACTQQSYGEVHDYTAVIMPPTDMTYISSTSTQTVTGNVLLGATDVQIIGIQVITFGSLNPVSATSFTLNNDGTTDPADVTNCKLYYTGNSPNFAATDLFGSSADLSGPITGNQQLAQGINYFWLVYDISPTATIGDYIDAEFTSVTVGGSSYTPTVTDPAGNRQLGYCTPVSTFSCYSAYIDGVVLNTLSNLVTFCNGNFNGYINYAPVGNLTTTLEIGTSYPITLSAPFNPVAFGVWIDFNNNGDFNDAGDFVFASSAIMTGDQTGTIAIPNNPAYIGDHLMRVRATSGFVLNSTQSCSQFTYGETEDYTITFGAASPMTFVSSTTTQNNTAFVQKGTPDAEIIGIQVVTSGALNPFDVTSITVNSNGSTNFSNDVSNVKIYYTGTNSNFGTTTLFGSSADLSSPITGNVTLDAGTNYFWVTYDVKPTALIGNQLDAECTQIVMTGNGGTQLPAITAPAGSRQIDYCVAVNQYDCSYSYIDGVVLNSLSNVSTGCNGNVGSYVQYAPVGNYTTDLEAGGTYSISLTGPSFYNSVGFGVWIDFNDDGDFSDTGEFAWSSPTYASGTQVGSISVPGAATIGDHRMRIRSSYYNTLTSSQACGETFNNGETEDYTISITPQSNMVYVSSNVTQDNTGSVTSGEPDAEIVGIQILTAGSLNPFNVTSFHITDNGSSNFASDVTNVKIWYTGTNPTFSTGTLFGSTTTLPADITGSQALAGGTNYFWVTYDVSPTAILGDFLDAECTQIVMSGAGGTQTPLVTAPAGNREINYCIGTVQYGCYNGFIDGVILNTLSNTSTGCNGNVDSYIQYPQSGNTTTQLELGQTYSLELDGPTGGYFYDYVGFGVWIDYNGNGNFNDPGEFVYGSPTYMFGAQFTSITLPCDIAFVGDRRMRVRSNYYNTVADSQACSMFYNGETEDYTLTLSPPTTSQTYTSSTCTQNNQSSVSSGTPDAEILGIQIVGAGCSNPLTATSFTLNSSGSTDFLNDVTNVKIYYTGTDPGFAATNLFGSATDLSLPISGSQALNSGTNYFWVAYDVSPNATLGDFIDAGCTNIEITGYGSASPSNANPFGNREINFCVPTLQYDCFYYGYYINDVIFNTLSNTFSGCNGNDNNYINYAPNGNFTTTVQGANTYDITLNSYYQMGFGVWIDFNGNNDFGDPGEFVYASPSYGTSFTAPITIPIDPSFYGDRRMRVRGVAFNTLGAQDYCSNIFYQGETEDYTITILSPPACTGTPTAGTVTADPFLVCGAGNSADLVLSDYSPLGDLTFQWQSSPDGSSWSPIPGATGTTYSEVLAASTYYMVEVTCTNSGLSSNSSSAYVQVGGNEQITSTTGATVCGEDSTDITATGNGNYVIWYGSAASTTPLYYSSSPSTYTAFVSATTTFYAAAANGVVNTGNVGPTSDSIGPISSNFTFIGETFNVIKPCSISGVYVYPVSAGDVTLQLIDQEFGGQLAIITYPVTAADINQKTYIPINVALTPGNNYQLIQSGGVTLYYNDFTGSPYAYPYTLDNVISITQSSFGTYYYFCVYDWVINYSTLCESARVPVTVTVTPSSEVTITSNPANPIICEGSGQSVSLTASGGGYTTFTWFPATGLSATTGATVTAAPSQTTQYTVHATDGSCSNVDTVNVSVLPAPAVTVAAFPDAVCPGGESQLYASAPVLGGYTVYQIPFAPDQTGGGTTVSLFDDQVSSSLPIGFNFNFYGNDYSEFFISSNGFLTFTSTFSNGCCEGQLLPNPIAPNNLVAFTWEDFYPPGGGTISYYTTGTAPFRKCVVEFKDVMHYPYPGVDPMTIQAILYETTNYIEIHTTSMPGNPSATWLGHTEGIENADGTSAVTVPGRNADNTWTATDDAWRFAPLTYFNYSWSPSSTLDNSSIYNPIATPNVTTTYTVTVTDPVTSCSTSQPVTVSIVTSPVAGTITPDVTEICGTGSAVLELTGYTPGASIQWEESTVSGGPYSSIPGATGSSYTTVPLSSDNYYVATVTCTNSATSAEAAALVVTAPVPPIGIDGTTCGPGTVVLGAIGTGNGELNWYYSQNGDNYLGSGSPFTTPFINQTTTFYVAEGAPPAAPLSTTYAGGAFLFPPPNGNMFNITALNDIYITGFDVNMSASYTSDFEVYYKTGSYSGSETSPQNWTLLGVAQNVQGMGLGIPTPLPLPLYLHVAAGQKVGIYITATNPSASIYTSYGSQAGSVYTSDNNIEISEGNYFNYPFSFGSGPYVWNGTVHYVVPGCSSTRTPILAQIVAPQVVATATVSTVCEGDPVTLIAVNFGQQSFTFEWMPQLPGMVPQDGLDDTVTVAPTVSTTFTVSISDPNAPGCDTLISIPITVNPTPGVFITNLDPLYYDNVTSVTLTGIPAGGTFSGPGMTGNIFNPSAVGPGVYIITYTYTDVNGCTGTYEQQVKVLHFTGVVDVEIDNNILVFPNPSEGLFNLSIKLPLAVNSVLVTIYDGIGRQVFHQDYGAVQSEILSEFDFSHAAKQSYYVTINVDGLLFYRKVTIQ